ATFGFHRFQFSYQERRLTMEEMLNKFIKEGKQEHEEIETFIIEFRTTNKLLLKERNNLLSELRIEVHRLSRVMNDVLILKNEVKGVTTRGGRTTTRIAYNNEINNINKEPSELPHDKPEEPRDTILQNDLPIKKLNKRKNISNPRSRVQVPAIQPFPHRLRKEKEEAQQRKFLEREEKKKKKEEKKRKRWRRGEKFMVWEEEREKERKKKGGKRKEEKVEKEKRKEREEKK
ncbi:hypothetical protein Tco_1389578, partial [Tanacetum coccineum]